MDRLSTGKSLSTLKSNNSKYKMYYDSIFASIPYLKIIVKKNGKRFARIFWDESQFCEENLKTSDPGRFANFPDTLCLESILTPC